jgi:hypothetical protein
MHRNNYPMVPMDRVGPYNKSVGRQKMSDGVTNSEDPNSDYADTGDDPATFSDADGIKVGLSQRTPMNYTAEMRGSLGVNLKSRGKYNGDE